MARPLRIQIPGALYYITAKGNDSKTIFTDHQDRISFLNILSRRIKRFDWICHSYVLMDNHYHLLVETPKSNLSRGMMQLNSMYTQNFNRRQHREGHLFQGRYRSILVEKELFLLDLSQYMMLNPVRAGLVETPGEWAWSSYNATIGTIPKPDFLYTDWILAQMGKKNANAAAAYKQFVLAGYGIDFPSEGLVANTILGTVRFLKEIHGYLCENKINNTKEIPRAQRFSTRPELEEIFQTGISAGKTRNDVITAAYCDYHYTMREIGDYLNLHYATISRAIKEHEKNRLMPSKKRKQLTPGILS